MSRGTTGEIRPESLYTLDAIMELSGFGRSAMRTARQNGLVMFYIGGRAFVRGAHFIDHIESFGLSYPPTARTDTR